MDFGICILAVIPVRISPSDKSEMTTQLLFGDLVKVLSADGNWILIKSEYDAYEGWVDFKQIKPLSEAQFNHFSHAPLYVNRRNMLDSVSNGIEKMHLPAGCTIYPEDGDSFDIDGEMFSFKGEMSPFEYKGVNDLLSSAMDYLSCPYLWGGRTYLGLDCSGFTQVVFKLNGIRLMRDAIQQSAQGELITMLSDSAPGDLAFFDHEDGRISHVGILLDQSRIIHCSGKVRIDAIDHNGIYNKDLKKYTHHLRLIRRMVV